MTIESWLENIGLGMYRDLFNEHAIDLDILETLTNDDLEKMGIVSLGHRKKILQAIGRLEKIQETGPAIEYESEVELRDYLAVIWNYRRFFIGAVIIFSLAFWTYKGTVYFGNTSSFSNYTALINLSFPGYEAGKYPNDSLFKIEDIIASSVLNKIYQKHQIDPSKVPLNSFIKAFKVSYLSSEQDFIKQTYSKRIDLIDKKLELVELEKLQAELKEELNRVTQSQVLLLFEKNNDWPLRDVEVQALLEDVPAVWKENAINEKGVFSTEVTRYEVETLFDYDNIFGVVDSQAGAQWTTEPLIGLEMLKKNIVYFKNYLGDVGRIPNIKNYKTPATNLTISDLDDVEKPPTIQSYKTPTTGLFINDIIKATIEIENFVLPNLIFSYTQMGIYEDSIQVFLFYNSQIFQLEKEKELLDQKSKVINTVMETYSETVVERSETAAGVQRFSTGPTMPHLDGSFLRDLIALGKQSDEMEFKKGLMVELKGYRLKYTEIKSDINNLETLRENLKESKDDSTSTVFIEKMKNKTKSTVDELAYLLQSTKELEKQTGALNYLDQSMYSNLGYNKKDELLPEFVSSGNIKGYMIGVVVVLMIVAMVSFLSAYIKEKPVV
jgi:hypothetical protein